jgi:hypothetical protein
MIRRSLFVLALLGTASAAAICSVVAPEGPAVDYPANPARHKVSITRTAVGAKAKQAISVAEAAYPAREDVLKIFQGADAPKDQKLWWYADMSGTRLPFAITKEAIGYYSALVKGYGTKAGHGHYEPRSNFSYKASAKSYDKEFTRDGKTFSKVWVVDMQIDYTHGEASGFMMMFNKQRQVIMDYNYKVLAIFGDGETPVAVT